MYPTSPEANVRLVNVYQANSRYEEADALLRRWQEKDKDNPIIAAHLYNNEQYMKIYKEIGPLETRWKANPMDLKSGLTLMSRYNILRRTADVDRIGRSILTNPRIGGPVYVQLAEHFTSFKRYQLAHEALDRYARTTPTKYKVDIERAAIHLESGDLGECFQSMAAAIRLQPAIARDAIRKDARFEKLRTHPRFGPHYARLIPAQRPSKIRPPNGGGGFGGFRTP